MPKALFLTRWGNGGPDLPPMEAEGAQDPRLTYTEGGVLKGGFSVVGHVPQRNACLLWVWAHPLVIEWMAKQDRYVYLAPVYEADGTYNQLAKFEWDWLEQFLANRGVDTSDWDASDARRILRRLLDWLGVTADEVRAAGAVAAV